MERENYTILLMGLDGAGRTALVTAFIDFRGLEYYDPTIGALATPLKRCQCDV